MNQTFISVPFKIDDNFTQIAGMGKFSAAGIILEYEGKLFGIIKHGVKEARISLDDILDVKFKKGVFKRGAKIEIRLKNFAQLSEMPNKDGKISLKIEKGDFDTASTATGIVNAALNFQPSEFSRETSPVSRLFEDDEAETKELDASDKT